MADNNVNNNNAMTEKELNEVLRIKREKLAALVEAGQDPFVITKYDQTHYSTDIKENFETLEIGRAHV